MTFLRGLLPTSLVLASLLLAPQTLWAETPAASAPKPAPYSLPFQLRPTAAPRVIRSDTAFAFYQAPGGGDGGSSTATSLLYSQAVGDFAPVVRAIFVQNTPPGGGDSGQAFGNPVVGSSYILKLTPQWKLVPFLGVALPIGSGGGDTPDPTTRAALAAGVQARSAMDNALFAVNYFTIIPGIGLSWVAHGVTLQAEATLLQLTRVRGDNLPADADSARTNFTGGLHAGYFLIPEVSVAAELRHQRWLSTPVMVRGGAGTPPTPPPNPAARDTSTVALGARLHLRLAENTWLRPALAYAFAIDNPVSDQSYEIVQLDVPVMF